MFYAQKYSQSLSTQSPVDIVSDNEGSGKYICAVLEFSLHLVSFTIYFYLSILDQNLFFSKRSNKQ